MIDNERQYHVTKKRIAQFEVSLASLQATSGPANLPPRLHRAMCQSIESQLADLHREVAEYQLPRSKLRGLSLTDNQEREPSWNARP
jgi:hypothetical protein